MTNVVGYSTPIVAQHTFAMALYLLEKLPVYDTYVKNGSYEKSPMFTCFEPFSQSLTKRHGELQGLAILDAKWRRLQVCLAAV